MLAKGGRTNIGGFVLRLVARLPFLFVAGRLYGPDAVGRFALALVVVELAALIATLGLKRGLAQALANTERPHSHVVWDGMAVADMKAGGRERRGGQDRQASRQACEKARWPACF